MQYLTDVKDKNSPQKKPQKHSTSQRNGMTARVSRSRGVKRRWNGLFNQQRAKNCRGGFSSVTSCFHKAERRQEVMWSRLCSKHCCVCTRNTERRLQIKALHRIQVWKDWVLRQQITVNVVFFITSSSLHEINALLFEWELYSRAFL